MPFGPKKPQIVTPQRGIVRPSRVVPGRVANGHREEEPEEGSRLAKLPPGQVYKPSLESFQSLTRRINSSRKGLWKTKEGQNHIRVMPPFSPEGRIFADVPWHYSVSPDGKGGSMCLEHVDQDCFICEMREEMASSRSAEDHKRSDEMSKKSRLLININDLNDVDGGIQVFGCSDTFMLGIVSYWTSHGDITDPEEGYDLRFTGTKNPGPMGGVKAGEPKADRDPTPIAYENWSTELKDLDNYFRVPTREYQQEMFEGKLKGNWS